MQFDGKAFSVGKVICVGRNYVKHIEELNNPFPEFMVLFQKSASAVTEELVHPQKSCRFEAEISLLMEKKRVVGVGAGLDLTLDEEQNYLKAKGLPWERAKSFPRSGVFTEFVPFEGELRALDLKLYRNGRLQQHAEPEKMIYGFEEIIMQSEEAFGIGQYDIIMTGTPEGVDHFQSGDRFDIVLSYRGTPLIEHHWEVN